MVKPGRDRVLVLAETEDLAADLVMKALSAHPVEVLRFDTADFPQRLELVASPGSTSGPGSPPRRQCRVLVAYLPGSDAGG